MRNSKTIFILIGAILLGCIVSYIFMNECNIGTSKEKQARQSAIAYITDTYPDFKVNKLSVEHEWKSNMYVVSYSDINGNARKVTFDYTGKNLFVDNYIEETSRKIISDYTGLIKATLKSEIESKVAPIQYLIVDLYKNDDEKRKIVLGYEDINNEPVDCTVGIAGGENLTTAKFAEIILKSVEVIKNSKIAIGTLEFVNQKSPNSRYYLQWDDRMSNMSVEQLTQVIESL